MTQLLAADVSVAKASAVQKVQVSWDELCAQIDALPATPGALHVIAEASRDLLNRTAELPDTEQGLLVTLTEYRHAVHAWVVVAGQI